MELLQLSIIVLPIVFLIFGKIIFGFLFRTSEILKVIKKISKQQAELIEQLKGTAKNENL